MWGEIVLLRPVHRSPFLTTISSRSIGFEELYINEKLYKDGNDVWTGGGERMMKSLSIANRTINYKTKSYADNNDDSLQANGREVSLMLFVALYIIVLIKSYTLFCLLFFELVDE